MKDKVGGRAGSEGVLKDFIYEDLQICHSPQLCTYKYSRDDKTVSDNYNDIDDCQHKDRGEDLGSIPIDEVKNLFTRHVRILDISFDLEMTLHDFQRHTYSGKVKNEPMSNALVKVVFDSSNI